MGHHEGGDLSAPSYLGGKRQESLPRALHATFHSDSQQSGEPLRLRLQRLSDLLGTLREEENFLLQDQRSGGNQC